MAKPYINPIGFIDRTTDNKTIFLLNNPEDSRGLKLDTPVTVWRYSPDQLALAKIRGVISAVGYVTATFRIVESAIDPRWPEEEILREKTPVYLALEGTFEPDPGRMLTREHANAIQSISPKYRKLRSGDPRNEAESHGADENN